MLRNTSHLPGVSAFLRILLIASIPPICRPDVHAAATEPYGLNAISEFCRLPYLKLNTMGGGQSSTDPAQNNRDFSNFLYSTNGEEVLLDLTGPGTIYRVWFTGFNPATDYIKVYFDGETTPRINMLLADLFSGTNAPFVTPLVGNATVSSGGFYCYLPLPFNKSVRITSNATSSSFYYNIGYDVYSPDTSVTTWTGAENSTAAVNLWNNAGADPKSEIGNIVVSNTFNLTSSSTQTLLDVSGPSSIASLKLNIPGLVPGPVPPWITDSGRADQGYSQFQMTLNSANTGVVLVRRLDYGIANQMANVYVDGSLVGQWSTPGSDNTYHWRDSSFNIPATFTAGKSSITVKVAFVSSADDWNEFHYWAYCYSSTGQSSNLTDTLAIDDPDSENNHNYVINDQTWVGTRTFQYPVPPPDPNLVDLITNLWLQIAFDNETNPSVCAPIGSFFSMGQFAPYATRALPVGVDSDNDLYCYFLMPFARRAVVQLISNRSVVTTNICSEIQYQPFTNSFANVGYFKTQFNNNVPSTNGLNITLLDAAGAGHFVGVVISFIGPLSRGYLEGNEQIYVDGSQTPAFDGTGTEDFFNAGWYFQNGLFTLPTHGNTAHLTDTNFDYTTAYRFFLSDAIPFRTHITADIQHGPVDDVPDTVSSLAYYYYQPAVRSVLTDQLSVGNASSEAAHSYVIMDQTWSGTRAYTFQGNLYTGTITNTGRADTGYSQFTMALQTNNAGAILRRQFDQSIGSQAANVFVDGALVGSWYHAGSNIFNCWRDSDFMIPASYTAGKSSIQIRIQFISSILDWNEFNYWIYSLVQPSQPGAPKLSNPRWGGAFGNGMFQFNFTGSSNTVYDVWASSDLLNWQWLGAAAEMNPGQYAFTDSIAPPPERFYRAGVP